MLKLKYKIILNIANRKKLLVRIKPSGVNIKMHLGVNRIRISHFNATFLCNLFKPINRFTSYGKELQ